MKKLIGLLVFVFIVGCASYQTQTDYNFVKVLGVTVEGDTILIDVNSLRPKVYYNYYYDNNRYPYNNQFYYNPPIIIKPPSTKPNRPIIKPIVKPRKNPQ